LSMVMVMMVLGEKIKLGGHPPQPILLAVVECTTSVRPSVPLVIEVYSNWSPIGARRFVELVKDHYYDDSPLFRVVKGPRRKYQQIVQFGISLNKQLEAKWGKNNIPDDPSLGFPFDRGYISFAGGGKDSRATQLFIAYSYLGTQHLGHVPWETPFGKIVSGMEIADEFYDGRGKMSMDMPPWGDGPKQGKIKQLGLSYLQENYPELSYIRKCQVVREIPNKMT